MTEGSVVYTTKDGLTRYAMRNDGQWFRNTMRGKRWAGWTQCQKVNVPSPDLRALTFTKDLPEDDA